ncbi:MAG: hypothetical protein ACREIW_09165 [Chthoniobacterales bacterium]
MKTLRFGVVVAVVAGTLGLSQARAGQPHMIAALGHLRAARAELRMAEHNKGGWRVRAVANVERAIADVERGMAAGR